MRVTYLGSAALLVETEDTDIRLLEWLLDGDHHAHWADAKIGSHLAVRKEPDIYERGLYNCMGAFTA